MTRKTRPMKSTLPRAISRPRSCTEMLTRWSPSGPKLRSSPAGFGLCWSTWASPPLPNTGSRKSHVQGGWSSRSSQRFSSDPESSADTRDQLSGPLTVMLLLVPPDRPSHHGSVATRVNCRICPLPPALQEERSIKGPRGEKRYPQDGDGTPPGCDSGAEHSSTSRSARDRDSLHPAVKHRRHHPRLHEDGRGSGQRPLCVRYRHLDSHLLSPEFGQGAHSEQPLPLRIPQSLGVT
jgi:hypothetical protein